MALFGKKKKQIDDEEIDVNMNVREHEEDNEEIENTDGSEENEASAEDVFRDACQQLANCIRVMFPKQMLIGFYYAELQAEGYIDDFCCYTTDAQRIDRDDIPTKCGMPLPDMVAREERLEQAFFRFRKAAMAFTEKDCNAVSFTMMNNGQVKIDITSEPLVEGEEEVRHGRWLERVDKTELRPVVKKISEEKLKEIQMKSQELYMAMGTEFYSMLPEADYKLAYFYAETNENGVFYHNRIVMNDGEIIDGNDMIERFNMDKDAFRNSQVEIVKQMMNIQKVFTDNGEPPFTNITMSVTAKGEFSSSLAFDPVSAATEHQRLEAWKESHKG